jgi:hypothetical protein
MAGVRLHGAGAGRGATWQSRGGHLAQRAGNKWLWRFLSDQMSRPVSKQDIYKFEEMLHAMRLRDRKTIEGHVLRLLLVNDTHEMWRWAYDHPDKLTISDSGSTAPRG